VGSVLGSWLAGMLADWNIERSVVGGFLVSMAALALVVPLAGSPVAVGAIVFTVGMLGSVLAITLQVRLMQSAGDAQMLGAALNHSALNIANGLGAFLGAIVIDAGYGYRAPSVVGAGLATAGLVLFLASLVAQRRAAAAGPATL
jgi:DHA1 family inner membrane transport protein